MTSIRIRPVQQRDITLCLQTVIVPKICNNLPATSFDPPALSHLADLNLADPKWTTSSPIDILLGADIYPSLLRNGVIAGNQGQPTAINTIFGWMLVGPIPRSATTLCSFVSTCQPSLEDTLKSFWEIESVPSQPALDPQEHVAETHFVRSVNRLPSGRFCVSLPFKDNRPKFVGSQAIAERRWLRLENRLLNQPDLYSLYCTFMKDYLESGHMSLINSPVPADSYFIPHHCVTKTVDGQQKIRVVFDASAKDANHLSLNDTLLSGPKLQADIVQLLLRFRTKPIVFICDIRQMYRQMVLAEEDRIYQYIRFRFSPESPVLTYQLNTVTYGVSSAPFLAIRTLLHLASIEASDFPLAARAIQQDLYVDDLATGANTIEEALKLRDELIAMLGRGQLELRKWASNSPSLLEGLPESHLHTTPTVFNADVEPTVKILGLQWNSTSDSFTFSLDSVEVSCTKRIILSQVARIYDPIGFLSPTSFLLKRMIQHLWVLGLDWDEAPPAEVQTLWRKFREELHSLSSVKIPRLICSIVDGCCELHAFSDASRHGYAVVVYVRYTQDGVPVVRLLTSKSKVAPLKPLSIPRLELCGAVLLARVVRFVQESYASQFTRIFAWSDSSVVLAWVRSAPHKWKTFVANRVAYIQDRVPPQCWHHIAGQQNPADHPSRGLLPAELTACAQLWAGPEFLLRPQSEWPISEGFIEAPPTMDVEERPIALIVNTHHNVSLLTPVLSRYSTLSKVLRIVSYILRFLHNCKSPSDKFLGLPAQSELHSSLKLLVKEVQRETFGKEINGIVAHQRLPSYLQKLAPFVDHEGLLRVGGRLRHSDLPFSTKHPLLLPQRHLLTEMIIVDAHRTNAHSGLTTTTNLLRQQFWIISIRRSVSRQLRKCNTCFRTKPRSSLPPMGDLPRSRISQLKPFACTGVDFCGPFSVTMLKKRGARSFKAYVCLFVCFATKAIHLEVTSDLSTEAFLAALRRFIARRGRCAQLHSDCGTNFVGAHAALNRTMQRAAEQEAISWSFNPPSAPHFGGLWESGVKSFKTHLLRVVGNQILTFEELITVTAQIEAVLNSRPLCSLSSDPNDLAPLTPGHFLTLEPLCSAPDDDLSHLKVSRLSRWQLIQYMHQQFWQRWNREYLHTLHQRSRWYKAQPLQTCDIGTLVLIKEDNLPPLKWRLGRITQIHPGADGVARVATVRTAAGSFKRAMVKLCALPTQ